MKKKISKIQERKNEKNKNNKMMSKYRPKNAVSRSRLVEKLCIGSSKALCFY